MGFRRRVSSHPSKALLSGVEKWGRRGRQRQEAHLPLGWKGPPGAFLTITTAQCVKGSM